MKFEDIKVGKTYERKLVYAKNGRGPGSLEMTYKMFIVAKNEVTKEVQAVVKPEVGKPTAPTWYPQTIWNRWK